MSPHHFHAAAFETNWNSTPTNPQDKLKKKKTSFQSCISIQTALNQHKISEV
jgi:hypothetical protein